MNYVYGIPRTTKYISAFNQSMKLELSATNYAMVYEKYDILPTKIERYYLIGETDNNAWVLVEIEGPLSADGKFKVKE